MLKRTSLILILGLFAILTGTQPARHVVQAQTNAALSSRVYLPAMLNMTATSPLGTGIWLGPQTNLASIVAMVIDPLNPDLLYAGTWGSGIYKSTDAGESWKFAGKGIETQSIDSIAIHPRNPNILFAGTHGSGIYKSIDGGASWKPANNGIHDQTVVYSLSINYGNNNLVYAGTRWRDPAGGPPWHGILYKSINAGESWYPVLQNVGGASAQDWVYSIASNPYWPDVILAATHQHGPYIGYDYGSRWAPADNGIEDYSGRAVEIDPAFTPNQQVAYYATWHGKDVYRSDDNGESWSEANLGLGFVKVYPNAFSIAKSNSGVIYLGSFSEGSTVSSGGIFKTSNGGGYWSRAGLDQNDIYTVRVSPFDKDSVYAGTLLDGLYKTSDGGGTWKRAMNGLITTNVSSLAIPWKQEVFASTKSTGMFVSTNGGGSWTNYTLNLGSRNINQVLGHPSNRMVLFALTEDAGLYQIDLTTSKGWVRLVNIPAAAATVITPETLDDPFAPGAPWDDEPDGEYPNPAGPARGSANAEELLASAPLLTMQFAPSNSTIAYLGTNGSGLYKSLNSGLNWNSVGLTGRMVRSLAINYTNANYLYAATDVPGRVYYSINGGAAWYYLSLPRTDLTIYSVAATSANHMIWVGTSSGLWRYAEGVWYQAGLDGIPVTVVATRPSEGNTIYAGTNDGAWVYYGKENWRYLSATLKGFTIQSINFDPAEPNVVYLGTPSRGAVRVSISQP